MSRKVFMSVGGRYWSTLITRLFFKVLIQNISLFILRYPRYILKLRQWERLFWSIHCMLCCVTHMHLVMHTIRSACPLSLFLSLSESFFGLFPSPSPLTYASYQNSTYTASRSNQVAPTPRGEHFDSIISSTTCHRGGTLTTLHRAIIFKW